MYLLPIKETLLFAIVILYAIVSYMKYHQRLLSEYETEHAPKRFSHQQKDKIFVILERRYAQKVVLIQEGPLSGSQRCWYDINELPIEFYVEELTIFKLVFDGNRIGFQEREPLLDPSAHLENCYPIPKGKPIFKSIPTQNPLRAA